MSSDPAIPAIERVMDRTQLPISERLFVAGAASRSSKVKALRLPVGQAELNEAVDEVISILLKEKAAKQDLVMGELQRLSQAEVSQGRPGIRAAYYADILEAAKNNVTVYENQLTDASKETIAIRWREYREALEETRIKRDYMDRVLSEWQRTNTTVVVG